MGHSAREKCFNCRNKTRTQQFPPAWRLLGLIRCAMVLLHMLLVISLTHSKVPDPHGLPGLTSGTMMLLHMLLVVSLDALKGPDPHELPGLTSGTGGPRLI